MCTRNLVGIKYSHGDKTKYLKMEDMENMSDQLAKNLVELQKKYLDVDINSIVETILNIPDLGSKSETKICIGNILEIIQTDSDKIDNHQIITIRKLISDLSNPKIRNIYNEIFPELGIELYQIFLNIGFNQKYLPLKKLNKYNSNFTINKSILDSCDKTIMDHVIQLYIRFLCVILRISEIPESLEDFDKDKFTTHNLDETIDYYNLFKFLKEEVSPIINSPNFDIYKNYFAYIPSGDLLFKIFLFFINLGIVEKYEFVNLIFLLKL